MKVFILSFVVAAAGLVVVQMGVEEVRHSASPNNDVYSIEQWYAAKAKFNNTDRAVSLKVPKVVLVQGM